MSDDDKDFDDDDDEKSLSFLEVYCVFTVLRACEITFCCLGWVHSDIEKKDIYSFIVD